MEAFETWGVCGNVPNDNVDINTSSFDFSVQYATMTQIASLSQEPGSRNLMGHARFSMEYDQSDNICYTTSAVIYVAMNPIIDNYTTGFWYDCDGGSCLNAGGMVRLDMASYFAHEYGHNLGFAHKDDVSLVMNTTGPALGTSKRELAECEKLSTNNLFACYMGSAIFAAWGAFADTAYCETVAEQGMDSLLLVGFASPSSYPADGDTIASLPSIGGSDLIARYQVVGIPSYAFYEWREASTPHSGVTTGPFGVTTQPEGYSAGSYGSSRIDSTTWFETLQTPTLGTLPGTPSEANCADIVVYAAVDSLASPVYAQIVADAPTLRVKKIIAPSTQYGHPDRTAQACRNVIATVVAANSAWNQYCSGQNCREYPVLPGPELYIVGDSYLRELPEGLLGSVITVPVGIGAPSMANWAFACTRNCRSDVLIYDIDDDGMPNGPLSRIPATTVREASRAAAAAADVVHGRNVDSSFRVARLAGMTFGDPSNAPAYQEAVAAMYGAIRFQPAPILNEQWYPPMGGDTDAFDLRFEAFEDQLMGGLREVVGYGGMTGNGVPPGYFFSRIPSPQVKSLTVKTRLVAWLPACLLHASWMSGASQNNVIRGYMFADTTKGMIAASVGHMDIGWFMYHERMGRHLLEAREAAGALGGSRSVARVAYDAVIAAILEGGDMAAHALSLSTWGSYTLVGRGRIPDPVTDLTAGAGRSTAAITWTEPQQEFGNAEEYEIRYQAYTPLSDATFAYGTPVSNPPTPGPGGTNHCVELSGLGSCRVYYFAIRTRAGGAWSPISNVATASTTCSGAVVALCMGDGLIGGGGGGESARRDRPTELQASSERIDGDGAGDQSLLGGPPGVAMVDLWRMPSVVPTAEARQLVVLRQDGRRRAEVGRVSLGYVDHPESTLALSTGDSVVIGRQYSVESVVDGSGRGIAGVRDRSGLWNGGAGDYLTIRFSGVAGKVALVLETRGEAGRGTSDSLGIDVQVPDGHGSWRSVGKIYPRKAFDIAAVPLEESQVVRVVLARKCSIRSVHVLAIASTTTPTPLTMESAKHSRQGAVRAERLSGEDAVALAFAESLSVVFEAARTQPAGPRDYFLTVGGSYELAVESGEGVTKDLMENGRVAWSFGLAAAYPNPSTGRVAFAYTLGQDCRAELKIYDVAGRLVQTLVRSEQAAGPHEILWDGRDAAGRRTAPGVYFYRLQAGGWHSERKLVVLQR